MPDPTKDRELLKPGGRGLFLIKNFMDKVEFNRKGNTVKMVKLLRNRDG